MGILINDCKKNDSLSAESLVLGKLARHLCLQRTFLVIIITIFVRAGMDTTNYYPDLAGLHM